MTRDPVTRFPLDELGYPGTIGGRAVPCPRCGSPAVRQRAPTGTPVGRVVPARPARGPGGQDQPVRTAAAPALPIRAIAGMCFWKVGGCAQCAGVLKENSESSY